MAELAVGLAIRQINCLLSKIVDTSYKALSKEMSSLLCLHEDIQFIKDELEVMRAFLRAAEERPSSDAAAGIWVKQVKELAHDVEDCIDEFSLHLQPHRRGSTNAAEGDGGGMGLWCRPHKLGARHRIADKMRRIKSRVKHLSERRLRYEITHKAPADSGCDINARYDPRSSALFVEESQLVAIERPRRKLVEWLLDEKQMRLNLLAIYGAGGLGKTTIAKKALESPEVTNGHFNCRLWITVSQSRTANGLLREMIRKLLPCSPHDLDAMERMTLIETIIGHLEDKKYAIVFDDIWEIDVWKVLQDALPRNKLGSKIIITTRKFEVGEACVQDIPGGRTQPQSKLSSEDSWTLFGMRVGGEHNCPEELKGIILQKCDGLPLAIIAIASALASKPKKSSEEWKKILENLGAEVETSSSLQQVMQVLNFSYADLPYFVKRCFLYLSRFPEDSLIDCKQIKQLWIAEGFISERRGMTVDIVAESYVNMLVDRCMIVPSQFSARGRVRSFRIHDLMLEMIVSRSTEENFMSVLLHKGNNTWAPPEALRYLTINTSRDPQSLNLSCLRSLMMFGDGNPSFVSPAMRLLRVLDLGGCRRLENEHLSTVCLLLHLKYLSLRNTKVTVLPNSIGYLYDLETLDIQGCRIHTIPSTIAKLEQLHFLLGGWFHLTGPTKLGRLRKLHELEGAMISKSATVLMELQKLNQLRRLRIDIKSLDESRKGTFCACLEKLRRTLCYLSVSHNLSFLHELKSPPSEIETLKLKGHLGTLPHWIRSLQHLANITLMGTEIGDDAIRTLGAMPSLVKLTLHVNSFRGECLCFVAGVFPSLKILHMRYLNLALLIFKQGAMCHLDLISMHGVGLRGEDGRKLVEIFGIKHLTSLKEIELDNMDSAVRDAVKLAIHNRPNPPKLVADHFENS